MKIYIPTKIDKNNLPQGEVMAINEDSRAIYGKLYFLKDIIYCDETDGECSFAVTHYLREVEIPDAKEIERAVKWILSKLK